MADALLIEAHYFPCIEYFINILEHDVVYIEGWESYQKQSYRNRCRILAANKIDILSVPVMYQGRNVLIKDIKIDYNHKWLNDHWGAIRSAYGKAPFFEYYGDYIHDILWKKHNSIYDLNWELLTLCLKLLGITREIKETSFFDKDPGQEIKDLRSYIHPKKENPSYISTYAPYTQIFGKNFVPNLSILDLLFCEGNNSIEVLRESAKNRMNK